MDDRLIYLKAYWMTETSQIKFGFGFVDVSCSNK